MEKQQPSWRHSLTQQKLLESVCSGMKAAVHQQSGRYEGKQWCEASVGARWEPLLCFGWLWHCRAECLILLLDAAQRPGKDFCKTKSLLQMRVKVMAKGSHSVLKVRKGTEYKGEVWVCCRMLHAALTAHT